QDIELSVVQMPAGKDPADIIKEGGPEAFAALIEKAITVFEFEVDQVFAAADLTTARGRDAVLDELAPIFELIPNGAIKDEQIRLVAGRLEMSESALGALRRQASATTNANVAMPRASTALERPERLFLAACLSNPGAGPKYLSELGDQQLSTPLMRELRDHLVSNFENPLTGAAGLKAELRDAVTEVAMLSERENASAEAIQLGFLQLEKSGLERALATAPAGGKSEIELKRQEVIRKLGELTAEFA
ncbi:MAG: hypothetical protein ACRDKI_12775, partial [Solirubrobacterales bacterium]